MYIISGLGAFQTFIFSLLLLTKKEKKKADKFLAGFFLVMTLDLLIIYLSKFGFREKFPDIVSIMILISLTHGPLLYFYVSSLLNKIISRKQTLVHLIPIIGIYLVLLPFLLSSKADKLLYFTDRFMNLPLNVAIGTFFQYLSAPVYFVWIIIMLRKHKQYLKDNHSTIDKINLNWMRKLLYGVAFILFIDCLNIQIMNFTEFEFPFHISGYIKFGFPFFIILIGYYGINQGAVFGSIHQIRNSEKDNLKYEKTKLISDESAQIHTEALIVYMQQKKAYLNSELRLRDVAINLDIPVHILSYIIKTKLNQNFYDFVNQYRIEESKHRLKDPKFDFLTILGIAYECGFNSKATFNRLFKKYTNQTPSQYKKIETGRVLSQY